MLRSLFGGAISTYIPPNFIDVSDIRQVPDNQEVYADVDTDQSIVVEILQLAQEASDDDAAKFHFDSLAHDNDAEGYSTMHQTIPLTPSDVPGLLPTARMSFLTGQQQVAKFRENEPEARNLVNIFLAVFRLHEYETDIVITHNIPILIGAHSSSRETSQEGNLRDGIDEFKRIVTSFVINDWVIKLGTSSICDVETHLPLLSNLSLMVETVVKLRSAGHRVVLVTSGAIGVGLRRLNMPKKPRRLAAIQAVAAVGQGRLMRMYDDLFNQLNQPIAQILLTKNDIADRTQYLNAVNTFTELLTMGVVPVVNENDTVSVSEIRFGDNDTLSAITAGMVNADYLFLMTDVDCLYTDNPRNNPDATPVEIVEDIGALREKVMVSTPGSSLGTGGMTTKLIAADLATAAGVITIISKGSNPKNIITILEQLTIDPMATASSNPSMPLHTRFMKKSNATVDRKWWILHGLHTAGTVFIDEGAARAVTNAKQKNSLFAAGITKVDGNFVANQAVSIACQQDNEIVQVGKGLVNYSSSEIGRIKGVQSSEIVEILGYADSECVVHRDNLAIIRVEKTN
ncbi:9503_t:CDS:2 [Paraglomus brasilianum]|uniref:9503_t:CDS:1 n=1 Tax=Paraglomus brasilianum TaxID=144538 RepID=A0A9N9F1T3_9GLOM|nr:9503_t:CDS:2 [Paraglomus brasilianum]